MDVWCNGQKIETAVCDPFQMLFPGYGYISKAWQNKPQGSTLPPFTKEAEAARMLLVCSKWSSLNFIMGSISVHMPNICLFKDKWCFCLPFLDKRKKFESGFLGRKLSGEWEGLEFEAEGRTTASKPACVSCHWKLNTCSLFWLKLFFHLEMFLILRA